MITLAKLAGLTRELTTGSTGEPLRKGDKTIEKTYIYVKTGLHDVSRNPLLVAIAALTPSETVIHTSTTYSPTKGSDAAEIVNQIAASVWEYGNSRNAKQFCYDLQICITSLNKAIEKHKGSFLTRMFSDKQKFAEDANNLIEALEWLRRNIDVDPVVGEQLCAELAHAQHWQDTQRLAGRPRVEYGYGGYGGYARPPDVAPPDHHLGHHWGHHWGQHWGHHGHGAIEPPAPHVGHGYSPHGMQPGQDPTAPVTPYGKHSADASDKHGGPRWPGR